MHHLLTIAGNTPYNEACTSHLRSTEEIPLDSFLSAAVGNEHYIPEQNPISREVQAVVPGPSTILAKNVSRLREEAKLTQYQLAQRAQINPDGLQDIENVRGNPRIGKIIRIASALKVRTGELLALPGEYRVCPHGVLDPTEALAHTIVRRRKKLKFAQAEFAEQAHISLEKLAAIENRDGNPTLEEMIRMALILKIETWQLFAPWIHS
jgi:transcriptional regulator with XRE-family HTH domain